jgi:hypothetical protein
VRRLLLLAVLAVPLLTACDDRHHDPLDEFASASCAAIQNWIDAIEDRTVELSRHVTPLEDASDRVGFYREFATAIDLRTWDTLRQLKRIAPAHGDGRIAADALIDAMEGSRVITQELIALADSFPDGDDDPEPTVSRISSLFIRLEKAFALPNRARDDLAVRYPAFEDVPACVDYVNPVS